MGQAIVRTCDCCGKHLVGKRSGVVVKGSVVQVGSMKVVLAEGEYCVDCAAQKIGHECPDDSDDPPD